MKRVFGYSRVHLDASYSARLIGASRLKLVHQDAPYSTPEMAQHGHGL